VYGPRADDVSEKIHAVENGDMESIYGEGHLGRRRDSGPMTLFRVGDRWLIW
jgi:hypothetical protein